MRRTVNRESAKAGRADAAKQVRMTETRRILDLPVLFTFSPCYKSVPRGGSGDFGVRRLEVHFHRQLNQTGTAEASDLAERRAADRRRWPVPIGMVHDVEEVPSHLCPPALLDPEDPAERQVKLDRTRIVENVASRVAEGSDRLTVWIAYVSRQGAAACKRRGVEPCNQRVGLGGHSGYHVRSVATISLATQRDVCAIGDSKGLS